MVTIWNEIKTLRTILIVGFAITIASCQPPVVFGEPQPSDTEPLSNVPPLYRGIYWCPVDSVRLFVDKKALVLRWEVLVKLTEEEIAADDHLELREEGLFINSWETSFPIERKNDTITTSVIVRDTLFAIGREEVLKPLKGHLILNKKLDDGTWEVVVVSQRGPHLLRIARADMPDDLSRLDSITPVKTLVKRGVKSTQILISPTKEEFDLILKKRLLFDASCIEFERIFPPPFEVY